MNGIDLLIIGLIIIAAVLAVRYSRNHSHCSQNCSSCSPTDCASCHSAGCKKKTGDVPDFVKAYRADHPKKS